MEMRKHTAWSLRRITLCAAFAALAMTTTACSAANGSFDRTLQVSGPVTVRVATGSGYIHVMPGDPSSVHIIAHIRARGLFNAADVVRRVENNPPIQQSGDIINIGRDAPHNVAIDYDITVPPDTELAAQSGSGDLRIANINGAVRAGTGSGSIQADGLSGHIVLHTGSGDIHASFDNSNDVKAQTGSGSITLKNVQGLLVAQTGSGDIDVSGTPSAGWDLKTGSGDVTLHTDGAHYSINATTGSGSVHSDQSISTHGTIGHHHITGDINGGGPTVRIVTGSGDIRIH